MSIKVALEHQTIYEFARPVTVNPHLVRLRPAPHSRTPIEAYSLEVSPREHFINWQQDPFGNWVARLVFPEKVSRLSLTVGLVADMMVDQPARLLRRGVRRAVPVRVRARAEGRPRAVPPPRRRQRPGGGLEGEALPTFPRAGCRSSRSSPTSTRPSTATSPTTCAWSTACRPPIRPSTVGIGSCRDSAWLLVSLLRQHGLAARFVSGYLVQLAPDRPSLDGPSGTAVDFTDLHAWTEVFIPGAGWVGLDPTSALFAGEGHIPLSATPHPSSAAPITGTTEPTEVTFGFRNEVRRIHEDPRTTKPYTAQQWARIDALGGAIDERLNTLDVPLTFGGEPTFVALDDATSRAVEHRRRRPREARARQRARRAPPRPLRRRRGRAPRSGQVVSGRAAPPLEHLAAVAHRRGAAVAASGALRRSVGHGCRTRRRRRRRAARPPGDRHPRAARRAARPRLRGSARRARRRGAQAGGTATR